MESTLDKSLICKEQTMTQPKIKLIYFKSRGRAELSRLILAQAGVEYEDIRIDEEEWPELKKKVPAGKLPVLEYDRKMMSQSMAIARFLAREFKLAGKSSWESALVDMIVDCINDVREGKKRIQTAVTKEFYELFSEAARNKKEETTEIFIKDIFFPFLKNMETLLVKNEGNYFVGDEVTMADIYMTYTLSSWEDILGSDWKKDAPNLEAMSHHVSNMPNIKRWIHMRPPIHENVSCYNLKP